MFALLGEALLGGGEAAAGAAGAVGAETAGAAESSGNLFKNLGRQLMTNVNTQSRTQSDSPRTPAPMAQPSQLPSAPINHSTGDFRGM
jgi:hypothetical protein